MSELNRMKAADGSSFAWSTASELGRKIALSGRKISNPFDPETTDFEDFNEAYREAKDELDKANSNLVDQIAKLKSDLDESNAEFKNAMQLVKAKNDEIAKLKAEKAELRKCLKTIHEAFIGLDLYIKSGFCAEISALLNKLQ